MGTPKPSRTMLNTSQTYRLLEREVLENRTDRNAFWVSEVLQDTSTNLCYVLTGWGPLKSLPRNGASTTDRQSKPGLRYGVSINEALKAHSKACDAKTRNSRYQPMPRRYHAGEQYANRSIVGGYKLSSEPEVATMPPIATVAVTMPVTIIAFV